MTSPGHQDPRLHIKTVFPRYGDSHVKDKTVVRPSYLWYGDPYWDPYTGKTISLYWDARPPGVSNLRQLECLFHNLFSLKLNAKALKCQWFLHKSDSDSMSDVTILMMTPSNGNIFRVTGHLCGKFTGHRWIPRTKASGAELWWFLWFAPE